MKKSILPRILTAGFLLLLFAAGSIQLFKMQEKYGLNYEQITTINGVSETQTVDLRLNALTLIFLLWLVFLLIQKERPEARVIA